MRAVVIARPGGPEVLEVREVPTPEPSRGEVRVRVRAAGVNRADLLQRMGLYPAPPGVPADIPGLELAGEVDALGPDVTELALGDRVMGLVAGGAYAEHVVLHERMLARVPAGLGFAQAAAIPEAFVTAYDAMVVQGGLAAGETALIHAVGSGVGTAAVQIARAIGAVSVGTARSEQKLERARELGMTHGVLVKDGKFADAVLAATGGVDVILELVGGAYLAEDLACALPCARVALVGLMGGPHAELDLAALLRKRVRVFGTVLRARPVEEKIAAALVLRRLATMFAAGRLAPVLERALPLDAAAEAHVAMAKNQTFGKVVLEP